MNTNEIGAEEKARIHELEELCAIPFPSLPGSDNHNAETGNSELTCSFSPERYLSALEAVRSYLNEKREWFSGYQGNQDLHYKDLADFLDMQINNIGDPYTEGNFRMSNKFQERAVLKFFSQLWGAELPSRLSQVTSADAPSEVGDARIQSYYDEAWGYVLSMGCTEGNMYALRNARDYLKGKFPIPILTGKHVTMLETNKSDSTKLRPHVYFSRARRTGSYAGFEKDFPHELYRGEAKSITPPEMPTTTAAEAAAMPAASTEVDHSHEPVLLYSKASHYSIAKIRDMLELESPFTISQKYPALFDYQELSEQIAMNEDQTMNLDALVKVAKLLTDRGFPIIICFNYGTTFTGAHDDVEEAYRRLLQGGCLKLDEWAITSRDETKYFKRPNFWIHVDGALGAFYGPYFSRPELRRLAAKVLNVEEKSLPRLPRFDFGLGHVMSIAMSGHKVMGAPFPTGIVMTKRKFLLEFREVDYIGTNDTTLSGSRSGLGVLIMWSYLAKHSFADHIRKYAALYQMATDAQIRLEEVLRRRLEEIEHEDATEDKVLRSQPLDEKYLKFMTQRAKSKAQASRVVIKPLGKSELTTLKLTYRAPNSLSIIFPRPSRAMIDRFSLSCDVFVFPNSAHFGREGNGAYDEPIKTPVAHIYCMDSFKAHVLDELLKGLDTDPGVEETIRFMIGRPR